MPLEVENGEEGDKAAGPDHPPGRQLSCQLQTWEACRPRFREGQGEPLTSIPLLDPSAETDIHMRQYVQQQVSSNSSDLPRLILISPRSVDC